MEISSEPPITESKNIHIFNKLVGMKKTSFHSRSVTFITRLHEKLHYIRLARL